jgi:hypothetical protein
MSLRPIAFSIPSTTELKVTFSSELYLGLSKDNFTVTSLNGSVDDLEVVGVTIEGITAIIKTRPQVSGNYYLLKFIDTQSTVFKSVKGELIPYDTSSRELFFVGIDDVNPFRDRMFASVPDLFQIENTNLKNILSAHAEEFYTAQKTIGEVLSNNYLSVDVVDELRTRTAGATDRLANENAYDIIRVSRNQSGDTPTFEILNYTASNEAPRSSLFPYHPVSLQEVAVLNEVISSETTGNSFDGFLINLKNKNVIKLLSVKYIKNNEQVDCNGDLGVEYDVETFKYSIQDNQYDPDYAFKFYQLESNQVLISEFGNLPKPSTLDTLVVSYLYKNVGKYILEDQVEVSRVEKKNNEPIPSNITKFFLSNAPIVNEENEIVTLRGVQFKLSENSELVPKTFSKELIFDSSKLPSKLGEYSVNYNTGEVFVVGESKIGEGTGRNNFIATYFYRKEFTKDIDYSIHEQNIVAIPNRELANDEAQIFIRYDQVFTEGVDYIAKSHIEVMPEFVENRLSQSFRLTTKNSPITDVFRIFNQTTGEVYNLLYHTKTEVAFSGNRSPEVKTVLSEEASFSRIQDEELVVVGEFVIPAFRTRIVSNASNNSIIFYPGIPAELISQNSTDYFFREMSEDNVQDINIKFFGSPDANNLITTAGISATANKPSVGSQVLIGTKGFIINLQNERILNQNLDSIGTVVNSSLELSEDSIFTNEKWFETISTGTTPSQTSLGGISRAFLETKGTKFEENLSRLRKVGDFAVDYYNGIIYVAIKVGQDIRVGNAKYYYGDVETRNKNILTASGAYKKNNSPESAIQSNIIYDKVNNASEKIEIIDLENSLSIYDGVTKANNKDGEMVTTCVVLDDYTAVVPYNINSINSIYNLSDLKGKNLKSSSPLDRKEEYSKDDLLTPVKQGGRNLYDVTSVTYEDNVIDFKKKQRRRVSVDKDDSSLLSITVYDEYATTFVSAKQLVQDRIIFDQNLNITKLSGLEVAAVYQQTGTAEVHIGSGIDLTFVDTDGDYLLDVNGNRFEILAVDTLLSIITVQTPADNNPTIILPAVDPSGSTKIVVKATVTFSNNQMILRFPTDVGITAGDLVDVTYLTNLIPAIGTPLAIDYRFGFIFVDYSYLADEIVVWYEYGDNTLDWSVSDALQEGEQYYVTYKYGALREALRVNFGSLTNIPFFQSFGVNTDRELYRDAIKATLQSFPKGPTISSYKELVKSFTKINPNINELVFGNWILGRDYLNPGKVDYKGVLKFGEGKFNQGLIFNDDVVVKVPALSGLSLDEGTIETWVRPEWAGINNDATLTFNINNLGPEKFLLQERTNPFDSKNNWKLVPTTRLVGSTDLTGSSITIYNYKSDASQEFGLDYGAYGIYKEQKNLDRLVKTKSTIVMAVSMVGFHFNDLRKIITESPVPLENCDANVEAGFTIGTYGAGSLIGGGWPSGISAPATNYALGSFMIADGNTVTGISLQLNQVPGFIFEIDPQVTPSNIESITTDTLQNYNKPFPLRGCTCHINNNIKELSGFNDLTITVELVEAFDFLSFKSSVNILTDDPGMFFLVDTNGIFYQIIGFYDEADELNTKTIPNTSKKFIIKKFGVNNPALSSKSTDDINATIPDGTIRLLYKSADILTKFDYSNSIQAFNFEKSYILDWSKFNEFTIERDPKENIVDIKINNNQFRMFYTDTLPICNLDIGLNIDPDELQGHLIGTFGYNSISNLEILKSYGTVYNRYDVNNVYIGTEGFNPNRSIFSLNRKDFPKSPVGEPPNADKDEGIFIWFDELCRSPIDEESGQWIFRVRSDRNLLYPVDVVVNNDGYKNIYGYLFPKHTFSGNITTDGEFSSVTRSYRSESSSGCDVGVLCNATFRYCGNQLLEDAGWAKIEDSDSDFINVIVGGRETQRSQWRKVGSYNTSNSKGIYRMGPSSANVLDVDKGLGNLVYTRNSCPNGKFEAISSLKVIQVDPNIVSTNFGKFSGATSGNITGINSIHISDHSLNVKVCLAFSTASQPLVLIVDAEINQILDTIPYVWNDQLFHQYRIVKDEEDKKVYFYIDNYMVSQVLIRDFTTPTYSENSQFIEPVIAVYLIDHSFMDVEEYHDTLLPNILDIDLLFFSGMEVLGKPNLESNDILISTDSKVEFEFNIDNFDGYAQPDGYDGYKDFIGVDEIFMISDKKRYLLDTGVGEADRRFSIFKDGKGFLNFRIFDDSLARDNQVAMFNLATSIKHFKPGEVHHIAASWRLNTIEERDEMHLFVDGQEAPNIYKFGGKVPVRVNDKFRDVSKEILYDFLVNDIQFFNPFTDGTISAGGAIFKSNQANFTPSMVGRSLIFVSSTMAPTLIGKEYVIKSVIDSTQVTLGSGDNIDIVAFQVSASDINFKFPATAGIKSNILTDIRNSRISIFRTENDGTKKEMSGIFYTVNMGEINVIRGRNVIKPQFRADLDKKIIEFIGEDSDCNFVETVKPTDIDVHIETYGLNLENCKQKLLLSSSSYKNDDNDTLFSGKSVIRSHGTEPVSLQDIKITRIVLDKTIVSTVDPTPYTGLGYRVDFVINIDNSEKFHSLTSESGLVFKQNLGRLLSLYFDSDNINYCNFDGYEDGYQDGYLDGQINTVTIYGKTTDGINEETYFVSKNGTIDGKKYFKTVTKIAGSLLVIDPDYLEAAIISILETNPISVSDNGGVRAEVFEYRNGHLILSAVGSFGTYPFEIFPGFYNLEYPAYLTLNLPEIGHDLYIGSNFNEKEQFGGIIDDFKIISEMSSDTRVTEAYTSGTRSVTDGYNKSNPSCADSQTLTLLRFDNPIELQARRLRRTKFLDTYNNITYNLSRTQQEQLLEIVNDSARFISKMINWGFSLDDATKTFYEVHRAEGGPLFNEAEFYRNVEEFPKSNNSVNDMFMRSGNFTSGKGLLLLNNDGKFRKDEGTIELWISPVIDTAIDKEIKYYVDIFSGKQERVKSMTSTIIELPNPARKILSIKLLKKTQEFKDLYISSEADTILFDEISRSPISGRLEGGTGSDKNFSIGCRLSPDGKKVYLAESLPGHNVDVVVTYVPFGSNGDRFSIFKNEFNQLVFGITAEGIDNVVKIDIDWKKNTWHRVVCMYKTNSFYDTMRIFCDGKEGGFVTYGTGLIYGTEYVYGQFAQKEGQIRNKEYNINLFDEFKLVSIGSDVFGQLSCNARMDNIRFSRVMRTVIRDSGGNAVDLNYSSNLNTVMPVIKDDATTLLIDFDADLNKIDKFATVIDPVRGIYNFDIEVLDNFNKVIGINNGEVEDLIIDLVNRLKPAHTNALVKFKKLRC